MITDEDIVKLSRVYATKIDLANFATKNDLTEFREEMVDKFDQVMTRMDQVYTELVAIREDQTVHSLKHEEIDEALAKLKPNLISHSIKK